MNRVQLFDTLSNLPPAAFERLLIAVKPPGGLISGDTAPQMNRVKALLDWAEGSSGRGIEEILVYLNQLQQGTLPIQDQELPNFYSYLQSILENEDYIERQEVYTSTTVEDRRRVPVQDATTVSQRRFSSRLKLRVETVKSDQQAQGNQPDGAPKSQEQVEQWNVLAGLRNYAAEHVVLIGKPGSGKSTSLERLLWEEAEKALQDPTARIPVLVKLRRCTGTIEGLIRDFLVGHQVEVETAQIEKLLGQGRFLLLLDGLNELPERFRTEIANFRDRYRSTTPMIVSTRELSAGGTLGIAKTLKMLPLTDPQMQEYVRAYLGEEGDRLFQQIHGDRLRKFAETPLLLWMLCRVFAAECIQAAKEKRTPKLPENFGLAFREFTQLYDHGTDEHQAIQEDSPVDSRDQWPKLLGHLAFVMTQGKNLIDPELSIPREEAEGCLTMYLQQAGRTNPRECAERWLKDLLTYHLIQPVIQPNFEEHIEFLHQLIQEYYAAEHLLRLLQPPKGKPGLTDEQLKRDYLNLFKWTEPIALMLALIDKENQALRVVKLAIDDVDLMLGARLTGKVNPTIQKQSVEFLDNSIVPPWLKIYLFGETQSEAAVPHLLQALENEDSFVRKKAEKSLENLNSVAVSSLWKALGNKNRNVSISAARILEKMIIASYLEALEHEENAIRECGIEGLRNLNSERSITGLFEALQHRVPYVRASAAKALGNLTVAIPFANLICATKDEDPAVCASAIDALNKLGATPDSIQAIIEDEICDTVINPAVIVDVLETPELKVEIPELLQMIEDKNPYVSWSAVKALGTMGSEAVIPGLIHALDNIYFIDADALDTVGKLTSQAVIPGLLELLRNKNTVIRSVMAKALGNMANDSAAFALPELLSLISTHYGQDAWNALKAIQTRCQFYNYEIWQEAVTAQNTAKDVSEAKTAPASNTFPNATEVKIIERIENYYENPPKSVQ